MPSPAPADQHQRIVAAADEVAHQDARDQHRHAPVQAGIIVQIPLRLHAVRVHDHQRPGRAVGGEWVLYCVTQAANQLGKIG